MSFERTGRSHKHTHLTKVFIVSCCRHEDHGHRDW